MDATPKPLTIDAAFVQFGQLQEQLLEHAIGLADRIAAKAVRRYSWLCADDLRQELLIPLPRWIDRYNPKDKSGTSWSKYLYHKMNFYLKDVLRREVLLGSNGRSGNSIRLGFAWVISRPGCRSVAMIPKTNHSLANLAMAVIARTNCLERRWRSLSNYRAMKTIRFGSEMSGLLKLAKQNRKRKQYQLLVDAGNGVRKGDEV